MSDYPRYDVEAVKATVSMTDAISRYAELGRHKGRCPCPIHGGKNDNLSFTDTQYHCFVCGAGGDVIDFTMRLFNLSFGDAVKKLGEDFGVAPGVDPDMVVLRRYVANARKKQKQIETEKFRQLSTFYRELWDYPQTPLKIHFVRILSKNLEDMAINHNSDTYPVDNIILTMREALKKEMQTKGMP